MAMKESGGKFPPLLDHFVNAIQMRIDKRKGRKRNRRENKRNKRKRRNEKMRK